MTKTTFIAALPDGSFATRSSKSKAYAFCVAARMSHQYAQHRITQGDCPKTDASNFRYYRRMIDLGVGGVYTWENSSLTHTVTLEDVARAKVHLEGATTLGGYRAVLRSRAQAALNQAVADGFYLSWVVLGWQSRHDLALTVQRQAKVNPYYAEVAICAAMPK